MTSQMDIFKEYLQTCTKDIEKELNRITKEWNTSHITDSQEIKQLNKQFTQSWLGGKMLRGTLVRLGFELTNNKQTKAILQPAAAFEILHTALLIHDDIIDQSSTRRGKTSLHIHSNKHYGISQAICLGDIGISMSGKLIMESNFSQERKTKALSYFFEMVNQTVLGEMMDVASTQELQRTEKQVLQIHKMKTARYTFVGPLTVGAILAGATDEFLNSIKLFAEPLGIAYQIQDDILGIFGDEKMLGKSTTSDIEENKSTLLITYALKHGNKQQLNLLTKYYGKKDITQEEQKVIKKIFVETGALTYSQNTIETLVQQTKAVIPLVTKNKKSSDRLRQLIEYLLERKK